MKKSRKPSRKPARTPSTVQVAAPPLSLKCLYIGRVLGRVTSAMDGILEASRTGNQAATKAAVNRAVIRIQSMTESFPLTRQDLAPVLDDLKKVQKKFPKTRAVGDVVMGHATRLGGIQEAANKTCSGS